MTLSAQTKVSTDQELRDAIADKSNIKLTADIVLSNSTLEIVGGITVTIDLGGYTLDRKLNFKPTQKGIYINNGKKVVIE